MKGASAKVYLENVAHAEGKAVVLNPFMKYVVKSSFSVANMIQSLSNFNSSASDRSNSYKIIQYNRNYIQYKMEK